MCKCQFVVLGGVIIGTAGERPVAAMVLLKPKMNGFIVYLVFVVDKLGFSYNNKTFQSQ